MKYIQDVQKVSVHVMITIQKSGAKRLCDHPVHNRIAAVRIKMVKIENVCFLNKILKKWSTTELNVK